MDHRERFMELSRKWIIEMCSMEEFLRSVLHTYKKVIRDYQAVMDKTNNLLKLWKKTIRINDERWHKSLDTGQGDDATKDDFQDTKRPEC